MAGMVFLPVTLREMRRPATPGGDFGLCVSVHRVPGEGSCSGDGAALGPLGKGIYGALRSTSPGQR